VRDGRIVLGPDVASHAARAALDSLPPVAADQLRERRRILVSGFLGHERERAGAVSATGLEGVLGSETPGSLYPIMARGYLGGALFHTPNVYDFPVCMHIARALGGDAVWVRDGRPVDFGSLWLDERSNMLRLPGIVACAIDRRVMATLVDVARDWSDVRYAGV